MSDYKQTYRNLIDSAESLPYGDERVAVMEKAIALADLHQDEDLQFKSRLQYVREVQEAGGFPEKYMAVFPWLLAYIDKNNAFWESYQVLWYYKWVTGTMTSFPSISKKQIVDALEDLKRRYRQVTGSDLVYHDCCRSIYGDLGDWEEATKHQEAIEKLHSREILRDCKACVLNSDVTYLVGIGKVEESLKVATPILEGELSCRSVPHTTYRRFIPELVYLNRHEEAMEMAKKLFSLLKDDDRDDYTKGYTLLGFMGITQNFDKGLTFFEVHFPNAFMVRSKWSKYHFYLHARLFFDQLKQHSATQEIELKLPTKHLLYNAKNTYSLENLIAWFDKEIAEIEAAFNARNGNDYFTKKKNFVANLANYAKKMDWGEDIKRTEKIEDEDIEDYNDNEEE